jgi:hypothetical protein
MNTNQEYREFLLRIGKTSKEIDESEKEQIKKSNRWQKFMKLSVQVLKKQNKINRYPIVEADNVNLEKFQKIYELQKEMIKVLDTLTYPKYNKI